MPQCSLKTAKCACGSFFKAPEIDFVQVDERRFNVGRISSLWNKTETVSSIVLMVIPVVVIVSMVISIVSSISVVVVIFVTRWASSSSVGATIASVVGAFVGYVHAWLFFFYDHFEDQSLRCAYEVLQKESKISFQTKEKKNLK